MGKNGETFLSAAAALLFEESSRGNYLLVFFDGKRFPHEIWPDIKDDGFEV